MTAKVGVLIAYLISTIEIVEFKLKMSNTKNGKNLQNIFTKKLLKSLQDKPGT